MNRVREHIDRGLDLQGHGDVEGAIDAFERAVRAEPAHLEAKRLLQEARTLKSAPDARRFDEWGAEESTNPETLDETAARLRRAQAEADEFEKRSDRPRKVRRRTTVSSPVSSFLARADRLSTPPSGLADAHADAPAEGETDEPSGKLVGVPDDDAVFMRPTRPMAVVPDEDNGDGVPRATLEEVPTRQIGIERASRPVGDDPGRQRTPAPLVDGAALARQRASQTVDRCKAAWESRRFREAARYAEEALAESESAAPPGIAEVIEPARAVFEKVWASYLGPGSGVPVPSATRERIAGLALDHRAGFLLSLVDGQLSVEMLVDIAGMPRFECLRTLARLLREGLIKFR